MGMRGFIQQVSHSIYYEATLMHIHMSEIVEIKFFGSLSGMCHGTPMIQLAVDTDIHNFDMLTHNQVFSRCN